MVDMLAIFAGYLGLHFGLYVAVLRHLAPFRRESIIFRYHALSALASAGVMGITVVCNRDQHGIEAVIVVAVHGIYSLSFLELWSLAQGGYSLRILTDWEAAGRAPDWTGLQDIGAAKKGNRLASLQRLGLVQAHQGRLSLSRGGRIVAAFLAGVVWLSKVRSAGRSSLLATSTRLWDQFDDEDLELPADKPLTLASYDAGPDYVAYVEFVGEGDELPEMPLFLKPKT
jgi:hypothetical protein